MFTNDSQNNINWFLRNVNHWRKWFAFGLKLIRIWQCKSSYFQALPMIYSMIWWGIGLPVIRYAWLGCLPVVKRVTWLFTFDSLNHKILLQKLYAYGFRGLFYYWLLSYLNSRYQNVDIVGVQSALVSILLGVPQGSVLGYLLFIVYINDLSLINNLCIFVLFAADTTVIHSEKKNIKIYRH